MTTKRFNEDDDKSIVEYGKMKQKELLNEIVKVERKYDLTFAEYIVCEKCGTIAYGDGNCHCGKNDWKVWGFDLREKIKEIKMQDKDKLKEVLRRLLYLQLSASLIFPSTLFIMKMINSFLFYGGLGTMFIAGIVLYYLSLKGLDKCLQELLNEGGKD